MDRKLHYNFIDILWAPARAFSAKKILVMTLYSILGLVVYNIFTYLALSIDSQDTSTLFSVYGFFPIYQIGFSTLIAKVIFSLGCLFSVLAVMLGFFGVSLIEIESIRGNRFYSGLHAIRFSFKRLKQIFLAELAIGLFVAFIVIIFALLGLASRLPFVGEWLYVLLFVIPNFLIAIITVFIILICMLSIILLPATASADKKGEAFQAILETFSSFIRQPLRWVFYTGYAIVAGKICSFVYAYFCYRSLQFMAWAASIGGGDRMTQIVKDGLTHLPIRSEFVTDMLSLFWGVDFGISLSKYSQPTSTEPVSYLMAFMIFIIFATVIGYFLAVIATAQARGYAVIRYLKDGYKIEDEEGLEG